MRPVKQTLTLRFDFSDSVAPFDEAVSDAVAMIRSARSLFSCEIQVNVSGRGGDYFDALCAEVESIVPV